jgi:sialic acid synthase SpsE
MQGPDHKASLEPSELKQMVTSIRNIELALGNGIKEPSQSEKKNKEIARKSIVVCRDLPAGHILQETDLAAKRPGTGLSPMLWPEVIGKELLVAVAEDEVLTDNHLKK